MCPLHIRGWIAHNLKVTGSNPVLDLNLPPPTRSNMAAPSRRMQVLILGDRRNYDPSIAGLGTGKAQRYFASDFDRLSDRLFDTSEIAVVEVVDASVQRRGTAALNQYGNAVLDRVKISANELHEEA
jgi:hypothetical protein